MNINHVKTHEDNSWEYGDTFDDTLKIGTWMKPKQNDYWFHHNFATIIRKDCKIPLNDEMLKQISSYEGNPEFLDKLCLMCTPDWCDLTDKQVNFLCRMLLAYYDLPIMLLKYCVISMIQQNLPNKEIENRMKKVKEKYYE